MSIPSFIKRICVQTAVYWGNPVEDGFGGLTFDEPVEISCRWEDLNRIIFDIRGRQLESKSSVLVTQELDLEGYLLLGSLVDIDDTVNPKDLEDAYQIISKDKVPMVRSTSVFVHSVILGFRNV